MASGRQLSERNLQLFEVWTAGKLDEDFRNMVVRGCLSRHEIAKECGFAKSALDQNPRIKARLAALEQALRDRGVLPAESPKTGQEVLPVASKAASSRMFEDAGRLKRLEEENACLRAEVRELKVQLIKFTTIREALSTTGRVPR